MGARRKRRHDSHDCPNHGHIDISSNPTQFLPPAALTAMDKEGGKDLGVCSVILSRSFSPDPTRSLQLLRSAREIYKWLRQRPVADAVGCIYVAGPCVADLGPKKDRSAQQPSHRHDDPHPSQSREPTARRPGRLVALQEPFVSCVAGRHRARSPPSPGFTEKMLTLWRSWC
jgi:hypothetical protein